MSGETGNDPLINALNTAVSSLAATHERVARLLCKQRGLDPDAKIYVGTVTGTKEWWKFRLQWTFFADDAHEVISEVDKENWLNPDEYMLGGRDVLICCGNEVSQHYRMASLPPNCRAWRDMPLPPAPTSEKEQV